MVMAGHMKKQKMDVEWKLEMEIGNKWKHKKKHDLIRSCCCPRC